MRKHILILGHSYAPQFVDVYNQYTRLFDPDQYQVTVAFLTGKPKEAVRERTIAQEVLFLDVPKRDIRGLKIHAIKKLLALAKERRFETVICHRYKPSYIMMWVSKLINIPNLIFVMHELGTMSSWHRRFTVKLLAKPNMFFAGVSNAVRDDLRKTLWGYPNERIVTLYNCIDVPLIEPQLFSRNEARKTLGLSEEDFVFGNVARLVPNKDQVNLIHSFNLIKPDCPKAKLVIAGDGILEDQLKALASQSPYRDDIIFTGFIDQGFRYMKAFDCFVLSSVQEAFGRVLLEAMIAKTPIIATKANGIPEVMGKTGTLIHPGDSHLLSSAMRASYQLNSEQRKRISEVAYEHMMNHFSIPAFERDFWSLPLNCTRKD